MAGGILVQAALLLAALLPISHSNPPSLLALVSGVAIGLVGGFVAGALADTGSEATPAVGLPVGVVGGLSFATLLAYLVLTDAATGVFWHLHYLLAVTVPPGLVVEFGAWTVVAFAVLCGLVVGALAVFGAWLATTPAVRLPD